MSDAEWTIDEMGDPVWVTPGVACFCLWSDERLVEEGELTADWESAGLPPDAHDALVECVRSHDTLTRAVELARRIKVAAKLGGRIPVGDCEVLLDLLTGEGQ